MTSSPLTLETSRSDRQLEEIFLVQDGIFVARLDSLSWSGVTGRLHTMFILTGNSSWLPLALSGANCWCLSQMRPVFCSVGSSSGAVRPWNSRILEVRESRMHSSSRIWSRTEILPSSDLLGQVETAVTFGW